MRDILDITKIDELTVPAKSNANGEKRHVTLTKTQLDLPNWLDTYYPYDYEIKEEPDGIRYKLAGPCFFDESHNRGESSVKQFLNGAITYWCLHETCEGRKKGAWQKFRASYDVDYAERLDAQEAVKTATTTKWEDGSLVLFDFDVQNELCDTKEHKDGSVSLIPRAGRIAEYIKVRKHFVTFSDTAHIYMYDADRDSETFGQYVDGAETWINEAAEIIIADPLSNHLLNEILGHIRRRTYIARAVVDEMDINIVPLGNGIINTATRKFEEFSPDMVFLTKWAAPYDDNASTAQIDAYMRSTFAAADILWLQEFLGWILERTMRYKKDVMLLGDGDNGKTVFQNIIRAVIGNANISAISIQELSENRVAAAGLYQMYTNMFDDLPRVRVRDSGAFKILNGDGMAKFERKFENPFYFRNHAKGIYSANELPRVGDTTSAFFLRWMIAKMPYTFVDATDMEGNPVELGENERAKDYSVEADMTTPEMCSSWINWMLDGLDRLRKNNRFSTSKTTEDVKRLWKVQSDNFSVYAAEKLEKSDTEHYIFKQDLRVHYAGWCEDYDVTPADDAQIAKELKKLFPAIDNYRPHGADNKALPRAWLGIRIHGEVEHDKPEEGPEPPEESEEQKKQKKLGDYTTDPSPRSSREGAETEPVTAISPRSPGYFPPLTVNKNQEINKDIIIEKPLDYLDGTPQRPPIGDLNDAGKTDTDFLHAFIGKVGSYKMADHHQHSTRDECIARVCKDVADEHAIHLNDVYDAWRRVCSDSYLTRELNEMFGVDAQSSGANLRGMQNE